MTGRSTFCLQKQICKISKRSAEKKSPLSAPVPLTTSYCGKFFSANGMDGGKDATILAIGTAETRFAALASGMVDAAVLIAPFTFNAKEAGFKEP
jgi:hypothetical protein